MINLVKCKGIYKIYINGKLMSKINNVLTDLIIAELAKCYTGGTPNMEIKYLAIGDDNTAPSQSDTTLGNEVYRKQVTTQTLVSLGNVRTDFVISKTAFNGQVEEVGIFGGTSATASADSGTLLSRILYSKEKTSDQEWTIIREDILTR